MAAGLFATYRNPGVTNAQLLLLLILGVTVAMFLWGRWRHDMVAMAALLACVLGGLVAPGAAFAGFAHPAVVTVASVLVLSRALQASGAVDALTRYVVPARAGLVPSLAALVALGAALSGFMNNVGAMALLMPVALQVATRLAVPPGRLLMPLAFGTILGGMTTMIGTPPNLIVAGFRAETSGDSFAMFDFTPVGVAVALIGGIFIVLLGPRLVPARQRQDASAFETGAYLTEARVPAGSGAEGMALREIESALDEAGAQVVGLVRNEVRMVAPQAGRRVMADDILVLEAEVDALTDALARLGLVLEESAQANAGGETRDDDAGTAPDDTAALDAAGASEARRGARAEFEEIGLRELVVRPESPLAGRTARDLALRTRYGLNLLAVSREGSSARVRLRSLRLMPGDVLLMQGAPEVVSEFAADFGCVPLAARELRIPDRRRAGLAAGIMGAAVAGAAFGLLPAAIAFALGVLASMVFGTIAKREVYAAVDWPVVVLLGALMPVADAMETSGAAELLAGLLITHVAGGHMVVALGVVLVVTMMLSDVMNNVATAAVMCPIAVGTAAAFGANPDTYLMAVAIGASCAFLTPIGHQNNTLILGPGGFHFGDYWRLGLPLEALVVAIAVPALLFVWPL